MINDLSYNGDVLMDTYKFTNCDPDLLVIIQAAI